MGVVLNTNIEALVSTSNGRVFQVMIDDDFAVSKIKTKYKIFSVTNLRDDILCAHVVKDQWKICIMDKNLDRTIKTILITDRGTLFSVPMFLTSSADKYTVYVLDVAKGCYGITIDGRIMFHYEDPNAECYRGLVIDSDGLIIGSRVENKVQVEKLTFSGERRKVYTSFGNSLPLNLIENQLVAFQIDNRSLRFYCLFK